MKSYVKFPWLSFTMTIVTPLMGYSTGTFNYLMLSHPNGVFDSIADVKSQIYDVIKEISLIPNNKKTVENTILRWHNFEINLLNDLKEINKALNETTDPVILQKLLSDVYIWLDKAALEGQIYDAIEICMNNILMNSPPNSFEYYIADVYFNSSNYTFKNSNTKIQTEKSTSDCSILTIDSIDIKISSQDIICEKISSIDADIICIQQLPLLDTLPIYDTLKHRYTSFAFIQNYTETSNLQNLSNKGIFLASKVNLEQLPLNNSDIEKDYLKLSISDTSKKIGYFYIYKNTCEQRINNYQFSNILTEVLNIDSSQYPVTLCGDFSQFFDSGVAP
jgi:hypothetical protein